MVKTIICYFFEFDRNKVIENSTTASVRIMSRTDNVAGVKLPTFTQVWNYFEQVIAYLSTFFAEFFSIRYLCGPS